MVCEAKCAAHCTTMAALIRRGSEGTWVLVALIVGLALGVGVAASGSARLMELALAIQPIGTLGVNAIRMTDIPRAVALLNRGGA